MKIYLLLAHPDTSSLNGALADVYEQAALEKGHKVRRQNLGDMVFNPILGKGFKASMELEPDLKQAQDNLRWCDHWVVFYPVWWGTVPALLKGFIDRTLLPGFAFKYHANSPMWDKLLKGRSAHLITTSDAPWWWLYFGYFNSDINTMKRAVLHFCGIKPVKTTRFSRVRFADSVSIEAWKEQVKKLV